ncbi:MAG: hypothetical protein AABO58_04830 [Acidobacteriota bacterium]
MDVVTDAVFETGPGVDGSVITSEIVAEPPLAIVPRLQVTVDVPLQIPWLGVAETNDGMVDEELFYVGSDNAYPTTFNGDGVLVIDRSTLPPETVVDADAELFTAQMRRRADSTRDRRASTGCELANDWLISSDAEDERL